MKILHKYLLPFFLLILVMIPFFASAQNSNINYVPLSPIPGTLEGEKVQSITRYLPQIFTLTVQIAAALAVIMITLGGIEYIGSESLGTKAAGKKKITNSIIGLLLIIGSWVILNTINPKLLDFNLDVKNPPAPQARGGAPVPPPNTPLPNIPGFPTPTPPTGTPPGQGGGGCNLTRQSPPCSGNACAALCPTGNIWLSDAEDRAILKSLPGVDINRPTNCVRVGDQACTTVFNLGSGAMSGIQNLSTSCRAFNSGGPCNLTITGGSEFWLHSSHGPGMNRVDLSYQSGSALDKYIRATGIYYPSAPSCYPGMQGWQIGRAMYILEQSPRVTTHWHVCY